jgi:hypothetical protein
MGIVHACFPQPHQLNAHRFLVRALSQTDQHCSINGTAIAYPFHPVQVIVRTDVMLCLPPVIDNLLPHKQRLRSMAPEELP